MVVYFRIEQVPDKTYFKCERLRCTLSTVACADIWREANHDNVERRASCKCCPIGAGHAGEDNANMSALKGVLICARCHRMAQRLIHGHRCVSCYNRERELRVGKNAKGAVPTRLAPLEPRRLWFWMGGVQTALALGRTLDTDELIVAALRDSKDRVRFAFRGASRGVRQLSLW